MTRKNDGLSFKASSPGREELVALVLDEARREFRLRQQLDNHDAITQANGLICPPEEDRTRQEFKEEADVNSIVARYYPFAPPVRPVNFGVQDMGLDLHSAMLSMQSAREAYADAPKELRSAFPTFNEFLTAFMDGKVEFHNPADEASAGTSAEGSSAAASESAPA